MGEDQGCQERVVHGKVTTKKRDGIIYSYGNPVNVFI